MAALNDPKFDLFKSFCTHQVFTACRWDVTVQIILRIFSTTILKCFHMNWILENTPEAFSFDSISNKCHIMSTTPLIFSYRAHTFRLMMIVSHLSVPIDISSSNKMTHWWKSFGINISKCNNDRGWPIKWQFTSWLKNFIITIFLKFFSFFIFYFILPFCNYDTLVEIKKIIYTLIWYSRRFSKRRGNP